MGSSNNKNSMNRIQLSYSRRVQYNLYDELSYHCDYQEMIEELYTAGENDSFLFKINSPGGDISIGAAILDAMQNTKAWIDVEIVHPSYSMASIIALAGDSLKLNPRTFLMFHDYSTVEFGKGNEIEKHTNAFCNHVAQVYNDVCTPFLSKVECKRILDGTDRYIHWDDKDLQTRIDRHFKKKKK